MAGVGVGVGALLPCSQLPRLPFCCAIHRPSTFLCPFLSMPLPGCLQPTSQICP